MGHRPKLIYHKRFWCTFGTIRLWTNLPEQRNRSKGIFEEMERAFSIMRTAWNPATDILTKEILKCVSCYTIFPRLNFDKNNSLQTKPAGFNYILFRSQETISIYCMCISYSVVYISVPSKDVKSAIKLQTTRTLHYDCCINQLVIKKMLY